MLYANPATVLATIVFSLVSLQEARKQEIIFVLLRLLQLRRDCSFYFSATSVTCDEFDLIGEFDLMDRSFKVDSSPFRIELSGISHNLDSRQQSAHSCSSSRSSEFQAVLDGFSTMKIDEGKSQETKKCSGENGDKGRLLNRRQNSTKLTPRDLEMEFNQVRRKSLPSLGLVAVEIQYSVPTKMKNSRSFPADMTRNIIRGELKSIEEIPDKGARKSSHFEGLTRMANRRKRTFPGGGRFSLGMQLNMNHARGALGTSQRRVSSEWRVKVHKRSLDISNDNDRLYPHIQTRRASFAGFSSFSTSQPQGSTDLFPRIGRKNYLVGEESKKLRTRFNGI